MSSFSFLTTAELHARGMGSDAIRTAIERETIERVIRGWYCTREANRSAVQAMRLGGRLGCISAIGLHGGWLPPDQGPHVMFPSHASGRRRASRPLPPGMVGHWHPKAAHTGSQFPVAPLELAIEDLLSCQPPDFIVAVLDSLLHRRLMSRNRLEALVAAGPAASRLLMSAVDGAPESGVESVFRYRLRAAGIDARVQVIVRNGYRVDVLLDGWLVIEIDGRGSHAQAEAFTRDRQRTATIMRDGRIVLQFAYATVMYEWPFVVEAIRDVMRHHAPVRAGR